MAQGAATRDYHRENLEGEQGEREGRESRERIIDPMAIGGTRVEGRGEGGRSLIIFLLCCAKLDTTYPWLDTESSHWSVDLL